MNAPNSRADELDRWVWRSPQPFSSQIWALVHGDGLWLALANAGQLATSVDTIAWDLASIGTNSLLLTGVHGNGRFVVGSTRGPYHSFDGHNWFKGTTNVSLNDLAFTAGSFLGVDGTGTTLWKSVDGSNWTSQAVGFQNHYNNVDYVQGRSFILGSDFSYQNFLLYSSTNGTNWEGPVSLGTNAIQKIVFGNGVYLGINTVLTLNFSWSEFRTSTNGIHWSPATIFNDHGINDVVFANGQFVALDISGRVLISADGVNWTEQVVPELFTATELVWADGLFVAGGLLGTILTSPDALAWTRRTVGPQNSLVAILRTNGLFVAVGGSEVPDGGDLISASTVVTSADGRQWTARNPGTTNSLKALTFSGERYLAVGLRGTIVSSSNATEWAAAVSPTTNALYAVACGGGLCVAVGGGTNRATILTSSDATNWTSQPDATNHYPLFGIAYAQDQFVAVGLTNSSKIATILTSTDGVQWTSRPSTLTNHLRAITYANGLFVAVGDRAAIATSPDALNWTTISQGVSRFLRGITYGNGWYVAVGYPPGLYASSDGIIWTFRPGFNLVTALSTYAVAYGEDSFFTVGQFGQVLESARFNPPPPAINLKLRITDRPFLSFTGPERHGYEIQTADGFPPAWESFVTITNWSATTTIPVHTTTNPPARYYRARLVD